MKAPSEAMHDKAGPDTVARIELLEGVRGFLASWVMFGHFLLFLAVWPLMNLNHTNWRWLFAVGVVQNGTAPVALFMIISGFVISHLIISRREKYNAYITRRFLRLFPAFLCCFVLGIFVSPLQSALHNLPWSSQSWVNHQAELGGIHRQYALRNILTHLTLLHGLIPKTWWDDSTGAFLGVGWSISTEWQFYLVAPLLIWGARKLRGVATLAILLICLSTFSPINFHLDAFVNESRSLLLFHIQYFFIGGVCYRIWRAWHEYLAGAGAARPRPQGLILCGAAIACFVPDLALALWVFIFSCLCQIASKPDGIEARVVQAVGCSEPALFIGRISYSVYLAHWPVAIILLYFTPYASRLSQNAFWCLFMLVAALATIGVSTLLYYFVEAPAIRWGKKLFKEDRGPVDLAPVVTPRQEA